MGMRKIMNKTLKLAVTVGLGVALFSGASVRAFAQETDATSNKIVPSLEYQQSDVREALQALFKAVGASYSIAPEVQGQITVSLRNVQFSTALQNILRQVDATYRIEGGVWEIVKREDHVGTPVPGDPEPVIGSREVLRRIKINSADPELIALLLGAAKGTQTWNLPPEVSSLTKGGGQRGGGTNSASGLGGGNSGGGSSSFGSNGGGFGGGFGGGGVSSGQGGGGFGRG
jgi:type II secretory pathway component GspD/PulD (secretin)